MGAEVGAIARADKHEHTSKRARICNGYRVRRRDSRTGTCYLVVTRLRDRSFFFLQNLKKSGQLSAVP